MPASQVMALLMGGWLLGISSPVQNAEGEKLRASAIILSVFIVISGTITVFSIHELGQREYRESLIPTMDQGIPRYWQQGKQCKYFDLFE